jgi:ribosomal protein S18 acetylase RimI-like enzyme
VQADGVGRIPLIATNEEHRRQGVGRALIDASLRWFSAAGIKTVYVKTQAANYAALALYTRSGFRIASSELTFSAIVRRTGVHA